MREVCVSHGFAKLYLAEDHILVTSVRAMSDMQFLARSRPCKNVSNK